MSILKGFILDTNSVYKKFNFKNQAIAFDQLKIFVLAGKTDLLLRLGRIDDAIKTAEDFEKVMGKQFTKLSPGYVKYLSILSNVYFHKGDYGKVEKYAEEMIAILKLRDEYTTHMLGRGYYHFALSNYGRGDLEKAINFSRLAINHSQKSDKPEATHNLATFLFYKGDYKSALKYFQKAHRLFKISKDKLSEASSIASIGTVLVSSGKHKKAVKYFKIALKHQLKMNLHLDAAQTMSNLGVTYDILGKFELSKKTYLQSIKIRRTAGDLRGMGYTYHNLGMLFRNNNEYKKAKKAFEKAIKIRTEIGDKLGLAYSYNSYSSIFIRLRQFKKARKLIDKTFKLARELNNTVILCNALNSLCKLHYTAKNLIEFEKNFKRFQKLVKEEKHSQFAKNLETFSEQLSELNNTKIKE